jgi:hypothetical protein
VLPAEAVIDVRLVASVETARAGERIAYSLVNHGAGVVGFGDRFCVERYEQDQWGGRSGWAVHASPGARRESVSFEFEVVER